MRILAPVDHSGHAERAVAALLANSSPANATVLMFMILKPGPTPSAALWYDRCAYQRLEELAKMLRDREWSVETTTIYTRWPATIEIMKQAKEWKADQLLVGIHSLLGVRRRIIEFAFRLTMRSLNQYHSVSDSTPRRTY